MRFMLLLKDSGTERASDREHRRVRAVDALESRRWSLNEEVQCASNIRFADGHRYVVVVKPQLKIGRACSGHELHFVGFEGAKSTSQIQETSFPSAS